MFSLRFAVRLDQQHRAVFRRFAWKAVDRQVRVIVDAAGVYSCNVGTLQNRAETIPCFASNSEAKPSIYLPTFVAHSFYFSWKHSATLQLPFCSLIKQLLLFYPTTTIKVVHYCMPGIVSGPWEHSKRF